MKVSIKHVTHCSVPINIDVNEGICWYENVQEEWEALLCERV